MPCALSFQSHDWQRATCPFGEQQTEDTPLSHARLCSRPWGAGMGGVGWALPLPQRSPAACSMLRQLWAVSTPVGGQRKWLWCLTLVVLGFEGSSA